MTRQDFLGSFSILLQGPLFVADAEALAARCAHWRTLFPDNPIILAVSLTDMFERTVPGTLDLPDASSALLSAIWRACDTVVLAHPALPLPPVKAGLERNNFNLQIAAAKAGLAMVETDHVLRIRNDMTFVDDGIVDDYLARRGLPRGPGAAFGQRILISPWFTLDPQTMERLPFHFSDWFHLGRTSDIRALWDVEDIGIADATYYETHDHRSGGNHREVGFLSRLGAEQHLITSALRRLGRPAQLRFHNDRTDVARSLRLLADDFVVADYEQTPILFEKYAHLAQAHDIDLVCITAADWRRLVDHRFVPPPILFADKVRRALVMLAAERPAPPKRRWWRRLRKWSLGLIGR